MDTVLSKVPTPRSYAGTALMAGSATALPFALLWSWLLAAMEQRPFGEVIPVGLVAGLLFGVASALTMALFFKGETVAVKYTDSAAFLCRLNVAASQLGYDPASQSEGFFTFKPSFQAGLAAGRIAVQLQGGEAVVVGPRMYVRRLVKQLAAG